MMAGWGWEGIGPDPDGGNFFFSVGGGVPERIARNHFQRRASAASPFLDDIHLGANHRRNRPPPDSTAPPTLRQHLPPSPPMQFSV